MLHCTRCCYLHFAGARGRMISRCHAQKTVTDYWKAKTRLHQTDRIIISSITTFARNSKLACDIKFLTGFRARIWKLNLRSAIVFFYLVTLSYVVGVFSVPMKRAIAETTATTARVMDDRPTDLAEPFWRFSASINWLQNCCCMMSKDSYIGPLHYSVWTIWINYDNNTFVLLEQVVIALTARHLICHWLMQ